MVKDMEYFLGNAYCRCHDDSCKDSRDCLRWINRNLGQGWYIPHCESLNSNKDKECEFKISKPIDNSK